MTADDISKLDWECKDADTQYLTHAIHRYSGKFVPQIARNAIELLTSPGEVILDPYCGSGTTLLECMLTGRLSIGLDINPLAVLIAECKTEPISPDMLTKLELELRERLDKYSTRPDDGDLFSATSTEAADIKHDPKWTDEWYRKWFMDGVRRELIAIDQAIRTVKIPELHNIAMVALSDILRKSSNAHRTYPNVMFDKNSKEPRPAIPRFFRRLQEISSAISALYQKQPLNRPLVIMGDAGKMPLNSHSVDAVITHPPYIGSIPYAEYGLLSITWLGHDAKRIDRMLTGGRRQTKDVVDRFIAGFNDMLRESFRVLRPGGRMFMLLGKPLVKGERIELPEIALDLATAIGFTRIGIAVRNGINRRANLMGDEELLFLQKS